MSGRARARWSIAGRAGMAAGAGIAAGAALALVGRNLGASDWLSLALALIVGLPLVLLLTARLFAPLIQALAALESGVEGVREGDFSLRLAIERDDEVGRLVRVYNELVELMGRERRDLRQRELMLASVLEASPTAVLLVNPVGRILVANRAARQLFAGAGRLEGRQLADALNDCPAALAAELAAEGGGGGLVTLPVESGPREILQVLRHSYVLNSRRHQLLMVRRLTPEMRRQEAAVWKRVIRVVGHEINNSLAPIRSLIASGHRLVDAGDSGELLTDVLDTIDASAERLHRFVDGYRRVARLPAPRLERVELAPFLTDLQRLDAFEIVLRDGPIDAVFDPSQVQQVLINLVRNAREAGSQAVEVESFREEGDLVIEVRDRGPGMDDEAMAQALLPFWTTKSEGSGLGLALCREILDNHGGTLELRSRDGGGLTVVCRLPVHEPPLESHGLAD